MKKFLSALLFVCSVSLVAQSTTVTATITDTDGFAWKGGTYTISFVPRSDGPYNINQYTWTGGALTNPITGTLDSSGAMSVSVPTTSAISPNQTAWAIQICPQANTGCFSYTTAVSGGSMNLTSTLSALAKGPRFPVLYPMFGYGTIEVTGVVNPGSFFFDVTAGACKQYDGTSWGACSSGGTGNITGTLTTGKIPKASGIHAIADSALDDGVSTAGTVTNLEPYSICDPSSPTHCLTFAWSGGQPHMSISGACGFCDLVLDSGLPGMTYVDIGPIAYYGGQFIPRLLYSAAGTPVPTCGGATVGGMVIVSDATAPAYNTNYTSGGSVVARLICDGTNWKTM